MKLVKSIAAASVILSSTLFAGQLELEKADQLRADMRTMLSAMEMIQRGGFYSDQLSMTTGIKMLKESIGTLRSTDAKSYLPEDQKYADRFAKKRADMIVMYANDMAEGIESGNMDQALEDYSQILKQCTSCHYRIRNY
jgi:hypothetical protein